MTLSEKTEVLLVGCGKMGSALLKGWTDIADRPVVTVVEPGEQHRIAGVPRWLSDACEIPDDFRPDIIVLAVKPQIATSVAIQYRRHVGQGSHFLSIAAGRTIRSFEALFGSEAAITRAMPNTPAAIGQGVTVCCANASVDRRQQHLAEQLLSAVGTVSWVADEALMDAVTAVSGSGPAYVFLLVETLAAAGIEAGLPDELAWTLARETVSGTGALLAATTETAAQLRKNVTSPNGTTQAALDVLMASGGLQQLMSRAVAAAAGRSRELAS